jgi:hypothetical protein
VKTSPHDYPVYGGKVQISFTYAIKLDVLGCQRIVARNRFHFLDGVSLRFC